MQESNALALDIARARLRGLKTCTFLPGSNDKRFCRDTPLDRELSPRQIAYIEILAWKYRRQLPAQLVPAGKPADLPAKERPRKEKARPPARDCETPLLPL